MARALVGVVGQVLPILGLLVTVYWQVVSYKTSQPPIRWLASILPPFLAAAYGVKKRSLDLPAGLLAVLVGSVLAVANVCFSSCLLAFFITSSKLTKWKKAEKQKFEPLEESDDGRNWIQVFCNGGVASIAALLYLSAEGVEAPRTLMTPSTDRLTLSTALAFACLGSIACCCGDTWASEIGSVMGRFPVLITTFQPVPKGTNGGVSLPGLLASALGGLLIGVVYCVTYLALCWRGVAVDITPIPQWAVPLLGVMAGLIGSVIDSLLGATLQYSGYCPKTGRIQHHPSAGSEYISGRNVLSNNSVNLLSSAVTAILTPLIAHILFSL